MTGRSRLVAVVLAAVLALALLGGCTAIRASVDTENALHRAGFSHASLNIHINDGFTTVEVSGVPAGSDAARAAGVVWRTFPYRLDGVAVADQEFTAAELQAQFGARNPVYQRRTLGREFVRLGKAVLLGVGIGGLVLSAGIVLLIVFFVRRGRRATPRPAPAQVVWPGSPS